MGIDNGGTLTKASIYDFSGKEIGTGEQRVEMIFPEPGHTERDLDELWKSNVGAIRSALAVSDVSPDEVAAIAVTGHGNGIYFLGHNGKNVERGINSTDSRAQDLILKWRDDGSMEKAYAASLVELYPGQPPALLAWYKKYRPEVLEETEWFLSCKDYIRYRLTDTVNTEVTDLSGTGLVNPWTKQLDPAIFKLYGLGDLIGKFPPAIRPEDIAGTISSAVAAETGLAEGTPVAGGLFDIVASSIASGVVDPSTICVVGGTWSINEFITREPLVSRELSMNSIYCIPDYYLVSEASPTSASNLEWFVTNLLLEEGHDPAQRTTCFESCNRAIESTSPQDSSIVFFPYLFGSNSFPGATAAFEGLSGWHGRNDVIRAIYEGVTYAHRIHVDRLRKHAKEPLHTVRAAGGITKSPAWLQMFADVLGMSVEVTGNLELGTLGAALSAGVAAGVYSSFEDAVDRTVQVTGSYSPNDDTHKIYQKKYERFLEKLAAMNAVWDIKTAVAGKELSRGADQRN